MRNRAADGTRTKAHRDTPAHARTQAHAARASSSEPPATFRFYTVNTHSQQLRQDVAFPLAQLTVSNLRVRRARLGDTHLQRLDKGLELSTEMPEIGMYHAEDRSCFKCTGLSAQQQVHARDSRPADPHTPALTRTRAHAHAACVLFHLFSELGCSSLEQRCASTQWLAYPKRAPPRQASRGL